MVVCTWSDVSASYEVCTSLQLRLWEISLPSTPIVLQIFYLNLDKQPLLRRHIDGLPALYVDCNEDIDMQRDQAAKDVLAKQIKDFSNHVRNMHRARYGTGLMHVCLLLILPVLHELLVCG